MRINATPTDLIDQLRAWFHPKDRSIVMADDCFIEGDEISTPANPRTGRRRLYAKSGCWYDLDSLGIETGLCVSGIDPAGHTHSKLVAADGVPDPAWTADNDGHLIPASNYNIGSVANPTGNIYQDLAKDIYCAGDKEGLNTRFIWGAPGITDHFRSGVIPTGYSWLAAGNIDGTAAAVPTIISYNYGGEWLAAYPGAGVRSFLYKSVTDNPIGKYLYAKINCGATGSMGMRLDKNDDNYFYEFYFTEQNNGAVRWTFKYKNGGAVTTTSGTIDFPANIAYQVGLYLYDTTVVQMGLAYIHSIENFYPAFQVASAGEAYWGAGATHRSGLILKVSQAVGLCDVFYNQFA